VDESQVRVTVTEAAQLLGIERTSVKKRIQRGKLRAEKDAGGTLYVYLDRSETVRDQSQGQSTTKRDELVGELRNRVRSLERRLDEERESRRRADTIIAQLTQANTALSERLRELEASQTSEKAAQDVAEAVAGVPATQGAGEAAESDTEPLWMRNRWTNWLMPVLLGYALPIFFSVLGAIYVYIRAVNDQAVAAVLGTIISGIAVGVSLAFYWWLRREQLEAEARRRVLGDIGEDLNHTSETTARSNEVLDNVIAEVERREAWLKEWLKENPELAQRMEELE
jgi:excisionase family DNA binding protein